MRRRTQQLHVPGSGSGGSSGSLSAHDDSLKIVARMNAMAGPIPDATGNGFGLTVIDSTIEFGKVAPDALNGNAIKLVHKTNDYFTRAKGWASGDDFVAVSLMYKLDSGPSYPQALLSLTQKSSTSWIKVELSSATNLRVEARIEGTSQTVRNYTVANQDDEAFHNLVFVYDPAPGHRAAIDGVQVGANLFTKQGDPANWDLFIGLEYDNAIRGGAGPIIFDECRVWFGPEADLSSDAVAQLGAKDADSFP